jgi:hypothetical protein
MSNERLEHNFELPRDSCVVTLPFASEITETLMKLFVRLMNFRSS